MMAKYFFRDVNVFTSLKISGTAAILENEHNNHQIILSFKTWDEANEIVQREKGATDDKMDGTKAKVSLRSE